MNVGSPTHTERPFPYGERLIHANIESIQPDGPVDDGGAPLDASPVRLTPEQRDAQERASEMQLWWEESIARNMNLPDGYQGVAVLLIKWEDELEDLKTREETIELDTLFRENFHFSTEIVELNVSSKPQHQLNRHLSHFVEKYDGRNNLLIVYYTGHGVYREAERTLELTAARGAKKKGLTNEARANWNKAEEILRSDDVDADVLAILDSCFSSNLAKSGKEETRTYELMSACAIDGITAAPGPYSFTRALIDALKELLNEYKDRSFTTFQLNQRILLNEARRDYPSQLWFRLRHPHERHIRLAPLKPEDRERQTALLKHSPRGYLTLRFALRDESLNRPQIEFLTRNLSKAFNSRYFVPLLRIDWLGIRPARATHFKRAALAMYAIAQWKKFLKRKQEENRNLSQVLQYPFAEPEATPSSPVRKRTRDEMDAESGGYPLPKRGLLTQSPAQDAIPSPPTSDSC